MEHVIYLLDKGISSSFKLVKGIVFPSILPIDSADQSFFPRSLLVGYSLVMHLCLTFAFIFKGILHRCSCYHLNDYSKQHFLGHADGDYSTNPSFWILQRNKAPGQNNKCGIPSCCKDWKLRNIKMPGSYKEGNSFVVGYWNLKPSLSTILKRSWRRSSSSLPYSILGRRFSEADSTHQTNWSSCFPAWDKGSKSLTRQEGKCWTCPPS
jgi:hypothetical protein